MQTFQKFHLVSFSNYANVSTNLHIYFHVLSSFENFVFSILLRNLHVRFNSMEYI